MGIFSINKSKAEVKFLEVIKKFKGEVLIAHKDSLQEGFEYFSSDEYRKKDGSYKMTISDRFFSGGIRNFFKMIRIFRSNVFSIMKTRKEDFKDLSPYINELKREGHIKKSSKYLNTYPNKELWDDISNYAFEKWNVSIGFTEIPRLFLQD